MGEGVKSLSLREKENMKIVNPSGFKPTGCKAYLANEIQTIPSAAYTKVLLNAVQYDHDNAFDIVTNHRYIVPKNGYYLCIGQVYYTVTVADKIAGSYIYKNGSYVIQSRFHTASTAYITPIVCGELYLEKDDYIELYVLHTFGVEKDIDYYWDRTFLVIRQTREA